MAGEKEYKIRIATEGDPSGAKEVEKAIDDTTDSAKRLEEATESIDSFTSGGTTTLSADLRKAEKAAEDFTEAVEDAAAATKDFSKAPPLPFKPSEVQPAAKSIAELTSEVQRLERELEQVPVGGEAFVALGKKVGAARRDLADAHQETRKLAGVMGRGGNGGMAVLEFSRAFEDAQYGIRGVLNNIPGLIAMLGGGAGLAGVISLAAVAGTQLWEAFANSKDAEEGVDAIAEAADKLEKRLKALRDRRQEIAKIPTIDSTAGITEATTALRLQTEGFQQNIQAVKDRIAAEEKLDAILNQGALGEVDRAEASGKISGDDAAKRRADIERSAKQRQLARTEELSKLDEAVAAEMRAAAERELNLAAFRKHTAQIRLAEAEAEDQRLREELARRGELENLRNQVAAADAAVAALGVPEEERNAVGRQRRAEDAESILAGPLRGLFSQSVERLDELFAAQAALADAEKGLRAPGIIAKEAEKVAADLEKLREAVGVAAEDITDKRAGLALANQAAEAAQSRQENQSQASSDLDAASQMVDLQSQRGEAAQRSREQIESVLTAVLGAIGEAANQPAVQTQAEQVRKVIADGLQASEEGQVSDMLRRLVDRISTGDARRAGLLQQVLQVLDLSANNDRNLENQLRDIMGRVQALEANQGNPNP